MDWQAKWICPKESMGDACSLFKKEFTLEKRAVSARLFITAMGVYEACLNGKAVGDYVLAPGWTSYRHRLQYQEYDVLHLLQDGENCLDVGVGKGWFRSPMPGWVKPEAISRLQDNPAGLLARLELTFADGGSQIISTDSSWRVFESPVRFSEIYDGEVYDAAFTPGEAQPAAEFEGYGGKLIPQEGEIIREGERLIPARLFTTPDGDRIVDFGQNITGYVEISLNAKAEERVSLSFAEVMDKNGNFYNENYRSAKSLYEYSCRDGQQTHKPHFTFYGFRYLRINSFPGGADKAAAENFTAIALYSDIKQTGRIKSSSLLLNRLFENILWGQRGNFLDVPTDCPQRDERLGWTGDAQAFIKTACYNFDTEKFFTKWLGDMAADQQADGRIGHVIPDWLLEGGSAAWGDAATICPWELYLAYGNAEILKRQFKTMRGWVDYIGGATKDKHLWTGGTHFGDWLGLDAPSGSYKGSSREDFIASAFYARSTQLVVKAGRLIGENVAHYEELYNAIVKRFREVFSEYKTQTECVLALHFGLAENPVEASRLLAEKIERAGVMLETGFVGTPYLLHVLSENGYTKLAYSLLLREKYPSWLYPVTKGATTIWEHWDGIKENGDFWSADMNSYNHYAYGAVADWIYGVAGGIMPIEEHPGYEQVKIAPMPDERLDWLEVSYDSRQGEIRSGWYKQEGMWRYEITSPVKALVVINGRQHRVEKGSYVFYSEID